MSALEDITDILRDILRNQRDTSNALCAASEIIIKEDVNTTINMFPTSCDRGFAEKYDLHFPIKELDEFLKFDEKLKADEEIRREFVSKNFDHSIF